MENDKGLVTAPGTSPAEMIKLAISGGADLDKLEKLLSIQERWEADEAKKAYHKAMSEFKANAPKIDKDRRVGYSTTKGDVSYSHASLANVCEQINSELSKHGLSASFPLKQNGNVTVTCKITHVKGHSEETSLSAPADVSGSKNSIQAIGSTVSYLERYTLLALTGLATYEMDDDGKASERQPIEQDQIINLKNLIQEKNINEKKLLDYLNIEFLDKMSADDYKKALVAIKNYKKK